MDAAVFGSFDVVLHVSNEKGLVGRELILSKDFVDFLALIPNAEIRTIEVLRETGFAGLDGEMLIIDGAEKEGAKFVGAAEFEKFASVGEFADGVLALTKRGMKPGLELRERDMADMLLVEEGEREPKFSAKLFEAHFGSLGLGEDVIGGFPDGGKVVNECARPIKDDIANHCWSVVVFWTLGKGGIEKHNNTPHHRVGAGRG